MTLSSRKITTILGLTLDAGLLRAVEVRRSNGSVEILKQLEAPLTLDPLRDEPELVGREIRNALDAAKISTKRCVAGFPAIWTLAVHTKLPPVEGEDLESFLEIEAERGFACNTDELQISRRLYTNAAGERFATLIGAPKACLERLESVLVAAQLKPASLNPDLVALQDSGAPAIIADIAETRINLLATTSSGIVALRSIEGAFESEGAAKRVQGELFARELRITLGQMPPEARAEISTMLLVGDKRFVDQLAADIAARGALGLRPRPFSNYPEKHHGLKIPPGSPVSGALSLALAHLSDAGLGFEFLPPKPTFWEQMSARYSSRRLVYAGGAAAAVVLLVGAAFAVQQAQLSNARQEWAGMKGKVSELEELQGKIRQFRSWHDGSLNSLKIMRRVTEAFPEDGAVSAKIIEIRGNSQISCSGSAKDSASLLAAIERLRKSPEVAALRVDQMRGKAPVQFTFNFQWGAPRNED